MPKKPLSPITKIAIFAVVVVALYFGNIAVQTHLGEKALAQTGLNALTLPEALEVAKSENKLVLADLSAIWCPSCRRLDREVLSDETVKAAINQRYAFARVEYDSDEGRAFMDTYNVRGFPTLLVLDAEGQLIKQLATSIDPEEFSKQL